MVGRLSATPGGGHSVEARVADVADRGAQAFEVERDDGRRHHRELRLLARELVDGVVRALYGYLHQVFGVLALAVVGEGFGEDFYRGLRGDLARLRAAHAVGDGEDAPLGVAEHRVLVLRPLLAESAVCYRGRLERDARGVFRH